MLETLLIVQLNSHIDQAYMPIEENGDVKSSVERALIEPVSASSNHEYVSTGLLIFFRYSGQCLILFLNQLPRRTRESLLKR